ncbi:hypothetical protein [Aurantiacibacter suaedae]|uniref:hypothetical protein n=1 Tax=Aurantiacibacter suaedae TaxID=2545755 RepID=UPI0010F749AC|nr:hypothetical protein [Aurantiacibacter suaedae]
MRRISARTATVLALSGAFALAACQSEETEPTTEVETVDMSGGELIATPADEEAVDVDLPETPMTPVGTGAPEISESSEEGM